MNIYPADIEFEAPKEDGPPLNVSALRPLYIYMLLCQCGQITFADLNTLLLNHPQIQRTFTLETLNKYIYTLRLFGCVIHRFEDQGKPIYRLEDHPLKPVLHPKEERALSRVAELLSKQPISMIRNKFYALAKRLCKIPHLLQSAFGFQAGLSIHSGFTSHYQRLVEQFQKYCYEGQTLEIYYEGHHNNPVLRIVEPQEVIYRKKRLYLIGHDAKTKKKVRYDLEYITSHRQLPSRIRSQSELITVTFKLTGRVALNYRPYPGESVLHKGEFLLVKHTTDEVDQLLKRLLKYGSQCQIIAPASVRKEMLGFIHQLLACVENTFEEDLSWLLNKGQTGESRHK